MVAHLVDNPQLLLRKAQQRSFIAFLMRAWPEVTAGELVSWNWHLDAIAYELDRVARGENRRLIVNLPPRNGKSKLISVIWVAFMLGRDPTLNFVCVSYSNELSGKLARDCLSIMQSDWYRGLFRGTNVSRKRSASWDFETTRGGGRLATSVSGTLTGRGGDIIILDDVIKPEDATSDVARTNLNNWFQSTLSSRLNDKATGAILCVMQRLHQFDLSGTLLDTGGWAHLSLPATATENEVIKLTRGRVHVRSPGDVLHAEREPRTVLDELKAAMGSAAFNAQYQQEPTPAEGNLFRREWIHYYDPAALERGYGMVIQSWDTAIKTGLANSCSVCITAIVRGMDIYILDIWRSRVEFPELKRKAVELAQQNRPDTILIEDKASGQQLLQELRAVHEHGVPRPLGRQPDSDKLTRAAGVTGMVEAGQLHLPEKASWLSDFETELMSFPNGRHDDQVDALSQLMGYARQTYTYRHSVGSPPEVPDPYDEEDDDDDYDPYGSDDPWLDDDWS